MVLMKYSKRNSERGGGGGGGGGGGVYAIDFLKVLIYDFHSAISVFTSA